MLMADCYIILAIFKLQDTPLQDFLLFQTIQSEYDLTLNSIDLLKDFVKILRHQAKRFNSIDDDLLSKASIPIIIYYYPSNNSSSKNSSIQHLAICYLYIPI